MAEGIVRSPLYRLPEPLEGFNPHVTIAYARAETWPLERIEQRLAACDVPAIRFDAPALSLVRLRRGTDRWTWDREMRFSLLGAA
jgi:2'-5' RNA ligase